MDVFEALNLAFERREAIPTPDDLEHPEDVARIAKVLAEEPGRINQELQGEDGLERPIHAAANLHLARTVALLLDCGAGVNHRSKPLLKTPLHLALDQDYDVIPARLLRTVEILLRRGGDPNLGDHRDWSAAKLAAGLWKGHPLYDLLRGKPEISK